MPLKKYEETNFFDQQKNFFWRAILFFSIQNTQINAINILEFWKWYMYVTWVHDYIHGCSVSYVINDGWGGWGGGLQTKLVYRNQTNKKDLCMFVRCCCLKLYSVHACELRLSCLILKYKRFWPLLMCSSLLYLCTYKNKNANQNELMYYLDLERLDCRDRVLLWRF